MATQTKKPPKKGAKKKTTIKKTTTTKKAKAAKAAKVTKATKAVKKKAAKEPASRPRLDDTELRKEETRLRKRYPQILKGSLRNIGDDPEKNGKWSIKRTVIVRCTGKGCSAQRRVATSDLHQVKKCEACIVDARHARRRDARKALAEKPK